MRKKSIKSFFFLLHREVVKGFNDGDAIVWVGKRLIKSIISLHVHPALLFLLRNRRSFRL